MKDIIIETVRRSLEDRGFKRKATTWFLDQHETILLVNLQKSQWEKKYYINLAIWFKVLGAAESVPKEHLCHVRARLTSLINNRLEAALDLEGQNLGDDEREKVIRKCLQGFGLPFLEACSTLEGLKHQASGGALAKVMVHRSLKQLIS